MSARPEDSEGCNAFGVAITGRLVRDSEAPYLRHSDASAEVVRKINQGVVREYSRLVYSHEQTDELRRLVTRHCAPLPSDPLTIGRGFVNNPGPSTDEDAQRIIDRTNELRRHQRERAQSGDAAATQPPLQEITRDSYIFPRVLPRGEAHGGLIQRSSLHRSRDYWK
jgi:hypothetical protein